MIKIKGGIILYVKYSVMDIINSKYLGIIILILFV